LKFFGQTCLAYVFLPLPVEIHQRFFSNFFKLKENVLKRSPLSPKRTVNQEKCSKKPLYYCKATASLSCRQTFLLRRLLLQFIPKCLCNGRGYFCKTKKITTSRASVEPNHENILEVGHF